MKQNLPPAEQAIMNLLWENGRWMAISELIEHFDHLGKVWKRQTVNTFLARLIKKGLVVKNGRKYIYACTKEEYEAQIASEMIKTLYGGSLKNFIAALSGSCTLTEENIKELKEYLNNLK